MHPHLRILYGVHYNAHSSTYSLWSALQCTLIYVFFMECTTMHPHLRITRIRVMPPEVPTHTHIYIYESIHSMRVER